MSFGVWKRRAIKAEAERDAWRKEADLQIQQKLDIRDERDALKTLINAAGGHDYLAAKAADFAAIEASLKASRRRP